MKAVCIGKLNRKEYKHAVERTFPIKHACIRFDIMKAVLFMVNLNIYIEFDKIFGDNWR
jgi:hypothetical protein